MFEVLFLLFPFLLAFLLSCFKEDKVAYFKRFGLFCIIGIMCASIPLLHVGVIFGYMAYTINAALLAFITKLEVKS